MRRFESFFCLFGLTVTALGLWQLEQFHAFQAAPVLASTEKHVNNPILGRLDIPRLHLSLPILDNDDPKSLELSVGHIPGTSPIGSLGNAAIAGHRDTAFRPLRNIRIGDRIEINTGEQTTYVVRTISIVAAADTSLLRESSSPLLTLVTCYPFNYVGPAPRRFVIQAQMTAE